MINPLEVLFVKFKSYQLESDWITSKMATTYERWLQSKAQGFMLLMPNLCVQTYHPST